MRLTPGLLDHAQHALGAMLEARGPADGILSTYFRRTPSLGRGERGFIAETCFSVLRHRRSLEAAAGSGAPRPLVVAALVRLHGYSARALDPLLKSGEAAAIPRMKSLVTSTLAPAVRAELPDWLWVRLVEERGEAEATALAEGLLRPAPLDIRVNLEKATREVVRAGLAERGIEADPMPFSPAGLRLKGKPAINRDPLFLAGGYEVQDEGSQILAWLVAPRRGEMVADFCAGAGGKTLALAMLMRATGRIYAMDVSSARLRELALRARRAGVSSVHSMLLSNERDVRLGRIAGKMDRVLVDAPCSGFGTLRRNPDLKWRHGPEAILELVAKQASILEAAARLVKPGGRLVYATCSVLEAENEAVAARFLDTRREFRVIPASTVLAAGPVRVEAGDFLRLSPHRHATDGFFAAVFERVA